MTESKEVLTREFAIKRKEQIGDIKYDLFLRFELKSKKYSGNCKITFDLKKIGDVVLESISDVKKILINGNPARYDKGKFVITLNEGLNLGENVVEIDYEADYDHTGDGLHQFIDPEDDNEYIYSNFEPYVAHRMLPCFDQPDLKGCFKLTVQAPKEWKVISNEIGEEKEEGEKKIVSFTETKKLSTYLFHVCLGNYDYVEDSHNGMSMKIYFRRSMKSYVPVKDMFKVTKQSLDFYSEFFDYPYPFRKYDQIFVPEFNSGAMENPGAITFSEHYLVRHKPTKTNRSNLANTLIHEMAHMWFGDLVTMKWWDDLWLNESFADFMSYLAMVKVTEFDDAWENFNLRKNWAYYQDQLITTHPIFADAEDTDIAFSNFDGISYSKGASVLKQLMFYIGEEDFKKGIRNYFKKYEWENTEFGDFLECLEISSGKDLRKWFDEWAKTTGVNSLNIDFNVSEEKIKDLKLIQGPSKDNGILRKHQTNVAFFYKNENNDLVPKIVKKITYQGNSTNLNDLEIPKENFGFSFLNYGDHDYIKDSLDEKSMECIFENISNIKDDLTKQMIYNSLTQMVRDANLDPKKLLDLILENISKENKLLLLGALLLKLKSTLTHYVNDEDYDTYSNKFFDLALRMLNEEKDPEKKNIWFNLLTFSSTGKNEEKTNVLIDILEERIRFENFEFDQDKRWGIVIKLNSFGHSKAKDFLEKEKERDKSDRGEKMAAAAKSSALGNKKEFWELYISGEGKSLDYVRDAMAGFYHINQKEDLREYIDIFFRDIKKVFDKQDKVYAKTFITYLFPSIYGEEEILEKAKKYLETVEDKLLKKSMLEEIDNLERKLKVLKKYGWIKERN